MPILALLWSVLSSQLGVLAVVGLAAFGYGHHRASVACDQREAAAHARAIQLRAEEMVRQAKAADAIALADRNREAQAVKAADAMQSEIDALKSQLTKKGPSDGKAKDCRCAIDNDFARRVQRLDRSGRH